VKALQRQDFVYGENPVRTIIKNSQIWFVAKDVCEILELGNVTMTIQRLDEDEVNTIEVIDALGRQQNTNIVNEPGLYSLILTSRKPEAKAFKRWVTHEVLPAIRKTGTYPTKRNSFPWMDSLGIALRQDTRLNKGLSKPEKLRLRAGLLRQTQEETGHNYDDIISILETSANKQEQKITQMETFRAHKAAEAEAHTLSKQAKQALNWLWNEYAEKGEKLALERDDYLLVRYDLWKTWAKRHRYNLTLILRELHRQELVKKFREKDKQRYGLRMRQGDSCRTMVFVKREINDEGRDHN